MKSPTVVAFACLLLASCQSQFFPVDSNVTYLGEGGSPYCAKHNVPLTVANGYWTGDPVPPITPTREWVEHSDSFPNHIGLAQSLSKDWMRSKPHKLRYCQECESGFRRRLEREQEETEHVAGREAG